VGEDESLGARKRKSLRGEMGLRCGWWKQEGNQFLKKGELEKQKKRRGEEKRIVSGNHV